MKLTVDPFQEASASKKMNQDDFHNLDCARCTKPRPAVTSINGEPLCEACHEIWIDLASFELAEMEAERDALRELENLGDLVREAARLSIE